MGFSSRCEVFVRPVHSPGEKEKVGFANGNDAILTHSAGSTCSQ